MTKVLLVGGAGYIGSVLTGYLLSFGYRVKTLDCLLYENQQAVLPYLNSPNYQFVYGDLSKKLDLEKALEGINDVVILAGLVGDPITKVYPTASKAINEDGIANLLQSLNGRNLNKVVFVSTCSNYGLIKENETADENFELNPLSLYAKAKVQIEKQILSLKGKLDYHPTILRFATAFGLSPRMRFDLSVNEFVRELYLGKELLVYDAHTWRPYCHVNDFSLIIHRVLEAPHQKVSFEVFNAGGEVNNCTKQMIVDKILAKIPGAKVSYKEHGSDPRNYRVNFSKIRECLDFEPQYTVDRGVDELLQALSQHLFDQVDSNRNYYGNYQIKYETAA